MAIIPTCSYTVGIKMPLAPENYSSIVVTIKQGSVVINKSGSDLVPLSDVNGVKVQLTQQETAQFTAPGTALLQLKAYKSETDAPGSRIWPIDVYPVLNNEVLT